MGKITLHADATHQPERLAKFIEQAGIETAFLMNANPEQIQHALNHTTGIVVVRVYDPFREQASRGLDFEKDILFRHLPSEFVSWLNNSDLSRFKGNKRVRFILGWNEMYYNGRDYQLEQNRRMLNVAKAMVAVGYGVALFGLAADKTIQLEDVQAGVWTEVINWLKANSDWAHLDSHEYELGRLASQHLKAQLKPYPESIVDPASMAFSNWGTIAYSGEAIKGNYHVGRTAWLGEGFPYALGEAGSDYKDDGAIRAWMPVFMAKFGKPQGFPSNRDLYNTLLGRTPQNPLSDREFCEEIYKDLAWFSAQDKHALSHAVFAWNPQPEHQPFNLAKPEYEYLLELLGKQAPMGETMPEPIEFVMKPKRIRSLKESNIRSALDANSNVLHTIRTEWLEGKFSENWDAKVAGSAYNWHKIEVTVSGKLISGYIAKTALLVVEDIVVIPPPAPELEEIYYGEIYGATVRLTKAAWLDAIKSHEFSAKYHTTIVAALKTITPEFELPKAETEEKTDAAA